LKLHEKSFRKRDYCNGCLVLGFHHINFYFQPVWWYSPVSFPINIFYKIFGNSYKFDVRGR